MADPAEEYCCDWRAATARRTTRSRRSQPRGRSAGSPPATGVGAIAPWDDCADGSAEGAHQATARCLLSVTRRVYGTAPGGRRDDARRCRRPVVRHRCPRSCSHTWSGKMRRIFREHLAIGASHLIRDISYSSTPVRRWSASIDHLLRFIGARHGDVSRLIGAELVSCRVIIPIWRRRCPA